MASDKEKTPDEEVVTNITKPEVESDPNKIPTKRIIEMLNSQPLREELMPLLEDVLDKISNIDGLADDISNILKEKKNKDLTEALTTLQNKLQSIYQSKTMTGDGGGKRRRTKKRKHYKKRRATKHR